MESKRRADHGATGNDPDDLDTILNDVRSTLKQTKEMILQEASSRGITLEELEEEEILQVDTSDHPLHVSASDLLQAELIRIMQLAGTTSIARTHASHIQRKEHFK
ncbi:alpha-hydroxy-acid oxidizing protein [bacterium]|nr:alpha-hydroxy-acid oxidizing protein [bacterium]MCI0602311.1 alpha-hydroxy-acid oxidizing protein [bacterium]